MSKSRISTLTITASIVIFIIPIILLLINQWVDCVFGENSIELYIHFLTAITLLIGVPVTLYNLDIAHGQKLMGQSKEKKEYYYNVIFPKITLQPYKSPHISEIRFDQNNFHKVKSLVYQSLKNILLPYGVKYPEVLKKGHDKITPSEKEQLYTASQYTRMHFAEAHVGILAYYDLYGTFLSKWIKIIEQITAKKNNPLTVDDKKELIMFILLHNFVSYIQYYDSLKEYDKIEIMIYFAHKNEDGRVLLVIENMNQQYNKCIPFFQKLEKAIHPFEELLVKIRENILPEYTQFK